MFMYTFISRMHAYRRKSFHENVPSRKNRFVDTRRSITAILFKLNFGRTGINGRHTQKTEWWWVVGSNCSKRIYTGAF